MPSLALIITSLLFVIGLIGSLLPVIPGVLIVYLGMIIYGIFTGFAELTLGFFILQGLAVLLVIVIDYITTAIGTKKFGGSKIAMWATVIGLFVGMLTTGPPGIIFGPFLAALLAELIIGYSPDKALRSSFGTLIGLLGGVVVKMIIQVIMIIWFFMVI